MGETFACMGQDANISANYHFQFFDAQMRFRVI